MRGSLTASILIVAVSALPIVASAETTLPALKKQSSPQAVLDEHLDALNRCDWDRLVAQYPEDAQINLPNGDIVKGRAGIGELFAGFCKDPKDGGLNGINFKVEHSTAIGDTFATQWVATAPFLTEPYRGSDAYITKDGYMQAMVSTFDGSALKKTK
jgi:SnoaL-like protein